MPGKPVPVLLGTAAKGILLSILAGASLLAVEQHHAVYLACRTAGGARLAYTRAGFGTLAPGAATGKEDEWFFVKDTASNPVKYGDPVVVGSSSAALAGQPNTYVKIEAFLDNDDNLTCSLQMTDLKGASRFTLANPKDGGDQGSIPEGGPITLVTRVSSDQNYYGNYVSNRPEYLGCARVEGGPMAFILTSR